MTIVAVENWMEEAICRETDPDIFFPEYGKDVFKTLSAAKRICNQCPVKLQCLDYALANDEKHGVWAGVVFGQAKAHIRAELRRLREVEVREQDFEHGGPTDAGARKHYRRGEKPCPECARSALLYGRMLRERKVNA